MKPISIVSLQDLIDQMTQLKYKNGFADGRNPPRIWFRGHSKASYELLPAVKRSKYFITQERHMTNAFYLHARPKMPDTPRRDDFCFWLSRMQHYGLPTRLLDWTRSLMVAVYFAINEYPDEDGCVWALNPRLLNKDQGFTDDGHNPTIYSMDARTVNPFLEHAFRHDISDENKARIMDKVIACWAVEKDLRVLLQQSVFTIHESDTPLEKLIPGSFLSKIIIPAKLKKVLISQLEICGFTLSDIYPDIEHIATQIITEKISSDFNYANC